MSSPNPATLLLGPAGSPLGYDIELLMDKNTTDLDAPRSGKGELVIMQPPTNSGISTTGMGMKTDVP